MWEFTFKRSTAGHDRMMASETDGRTATLIALDWVGVLDFTTLPNLHEFNKSLSAFLGFSPKSLLEKYQNMLRTAASLASCAQPPVAQAARGTAAAARSWCLLVPAIKAEQVATCTSPSANSISRSYSSMGARRRIGSHSCFLCCELCLCVPRRAIGWKGGQGRERHSSALQQRNQNIGSLSLACW